MNQCANCQKDLLDCVNYCSWDCHVELALKNGGQTIAPNGLPIVCINVDNLMMEHEHADHPDYKFPVEVEFVGYKEKLPEWDNSYDNQSHALIYTDKTIALTLYECSYYMWNLKDGYISDNGNWKLTQESINKIKNTEESIVIIPSPDLQKKLL